MQVKQHPFSTWTTFGDRFCTIYRFLLVVLATFFYIEIFSNHYFLDLSYSTPSSRPWGKPCTASSTSHSPSLVCWNQYQFNRRILGLIVSRFGCTILLLAIPAKFSTSLTFSPCTFFWIFHNSPQDEDKGGSLPHQVLLLTLFFCWNVHHATSLHRCYFLPFLVLLSKARDKWSRTLLCVTGPISLSIFLLCSYCFSVVSLVLGSTYTKPSDPVL